MSMFRNYIKIAWRSLKMNRLFSIINILGLSIGLAVSLTLFIYILHERSFDTMYTKKERIHRVLLNTTKNAQETWASVPSALAPKLTAHIPEIMDAGRLLKHDFGGTAFIKAGNNVFAEKNLFWSDASIFDMFDIKILKGKSAEVLDSPNTIFISESTAERYFGSKDPIGETLILDNKTTFEVQGVFQDFPENSSLNFNAVVPFMMQNAAKNPTWDNASFETFILLKSEGNSIANLESKIQGVLDNNVEKEEQWFNFSLQSLEKIHLHSSTYLESYINNNGDINQIKNLTALALLILIIACINYMNLITARSQKRAAYVGINKTLGASFEHLITRFYIETGLITAVAIIIGVLITAICLPLFNEISGKQLHVYSLFTLEIIGFLCLIWIITTLISGSYPAIYLSRFSPREIFQPSAKKNGVTSSLRKSLVIFQFSASIVLIVGVIIIHQQLAFLQHKNLGYNPEQVIAISISGLGNTKSGVALLDAFNRLPNVLAASRSQGYPGIGLSGRSLSKSNSQETVDIQTNTSEHGVVEVLQLQLLSGQLLPEVKHSSDTLIELLVNKTAVDFLGFTPEEAIGKKVDMQLGTNAYIHGVVKDFNFASLHHPIGAYAFHNANREPKSYLLVRFTNGSVSETISNFKKAFKKIAPNSTFEYTFLDKNLEKLYKKEQRTATISSFFSILAIVVASLGLFGLAAYTAEQRRKEIGVRKVLGASITNIVQLLSKDFLKLVLISIILAVPIAWFTMHDWLQDFAYRIEINGWVFIIAGSIAMLIATLTISFQAI